jgi:hypothetical protein
MRSAAGEVGRLETSPPRELALLRALTPWFGIALEHALSTEEAARAGGRAAMSLYERIGRASEAW